MVQVVAWSVFTFWMVTTTNSIAHELIRAYTPLRSVYLEDVLWFERCSRDTNEMILTPIRCLRILSNPPGNFWTTWITAAFNEVKWCGVYHCRELFTLQGAFWGFLLYLFSGNRMVTVGKSVIGKIQRKMHERQVTKMVRERHDT
jgi:hypothetical protein